MRKILITIIVVLIPIVVISFIDDNKANFILEEKPLIEKEETKHTIIKLKDNDKIIELELEDYVIGVVACEMPALYEKEALKAQALAARTFVLKRLKNNTKKHTIKNGTSDQCYHSKTIMKKKWGKNYNKYYNKIKEAVIETKDEYMTYKDEIITAFYFSTSNGYTEYSQNVFVSSKPYLVSVASDWDKENVDYEKTVNFKEKAFLTKLEQDKEKIENIEIISRYKTNRVKKVKVNDITYTGVEFRTLLGLRSTDFDIKIKNNKVYITTRGYGHGVGMSQYGANKMAQLGYTYEEIVKYYYKNIEIKKYNS